MFDVFRSDALGAGKVSLAFSLRFRAPERTLTDAEVGALRQACIDAVTSRVRCAPPWLSGSPFVHRIRVRYAEIDGQGVVFNAHWLTYFDDTCTRFMESLGFGPDFWVKEFDVMLVKATLEWSGPARFDDWIEVDGRRRPASARSRSTCGIARRWPATAVCEAVITYVAVQPGANTSRPGARSGSDRSDHIA